MESKGKTVLLYNGVFAVSKRADENMSLPLMALSAYLKAHGYQCRVIFDSTTQEELKELLSECLALGISMYTGSSIVSSINMAARVKLLSPSLPVVCGGYHPSFEAAQVLDCPFFDYVVRGEGEETLLELVKMIASGGVAEPSRVRGLSYRLDGGGVAHNPERMALPVQEYPPMDYGLYKGMRFNDVPYISSRGCPARCRFCCSQKYGEMRGRRYDSLSPERVCREVKQVVADFNPKRILFWDDTFLLNQDRIMKFVSEWQRLGLTVPWIAQGRCDTFSRIGDQCLPALKSCNAQRLYFGVETGSPRMLQHIRKDIKVEQVLATAECLARHKMEGQFMFINGFPTETLEDVEQSLELRRKIKSMWDGLSVVFFVYNPLPGTEMYDECVEKWGWPKRKKLEDWTEGYEFHTFRPPWLPYKHRNRITAISWASVFENQYLLDSYPWLLRKAMALMYADSRLRLQHSWFGFAPELQLISSLVLAKTKYDLRRLNMATRKVRCIPQTNHPDTTDKAATLVCASNKQP